MVGLLDQQHPAEACQESIGPIRRCVHNFGFQAIAFLLGIALAFM